MVRFNAIVFGLNFVSFQRRSLQKHKYKQGFLVLDVLLQWLMDYNAKKWHKYTYKTWTIGRVALATPDGAKACVLWTEATKIVQPIQWSRVL